MSFGLCKAYFHCCCGGCCLFLILSLAFRSTLRYYSSLSSDDSSNWSSFNLHYTFGNLNKHSLLKIHYFGTLNYKIIHEVMKVNILLTLLKIISLFLIYIFATGLMIGFARSLFDYFVYSYFLINFHFLSTSSDFD